MCTRYKWWAQRVCLLKPLGARCQRPLFRLNRGRDHYDCRGYKVRFGRMACLATILIAVKIATCNGVEKRQFLLGLSHDSPFPPVVLAADSPAVVPVCHRRASTSAASTYGLLV